MNLNELRNGHIWDLTLMTQTTSLIWLEIKYLDQELDLIPNANVGESPWPFHIGL